MSIKGKVDELVAAGEKIAAVTKPWTEVLAYFRERGLSCAQALLETRVSSEVPCYECKGVLRLALFPLHSSAAALKEGEYEILPCSAGFAAMYSAGAEVQSALLNSHLDHVGF